MLLKRNPPKNIRKEDLYLFEQEFQIEIPEPKTVQYEDCTVFDNGVTYSKNNLVMESLVDKSFAHKYRKIFFIKSKFTHRRLTADDSKQYLLVFDEWSLGYFHWVCDALPRLFLVKDKLPGTVLLLPENFRQEYHCATLELFGVKEIFYLPENSFVKVKKLIIPSHLATTGNYHPHIIKQLSDEIKKNKKNISKGERIYISRAKSRKRKIVNEEEVVSCLRQFGFEAVYFEDYPFLEQVGIAANARYIIGAHGAGLTNMLFMNPGSRVLELRAENEDEVNCYFSLPSAVEMDYYYQCCKKENPKESENKSNLVVDIEALKKNVWLMLG